MASTVASKTNSIVIPAQEGIIKTMPSSLIDFGTPDRRLRGNDGFVWVILQVGIRLF